MKVLVTRGGYLSGDDDPTMKPEVLETELKRQGVSEAVSVYVGLGLIVGCLIFYRHRDNIKRLRGGVEKKISRKSE